MSYSQFSLKEIKSKFSIKVLEEQEIFSNLKSVQPTALLRDMLALPYL